MMSATAAARAAGAQGRPGGVTVDPTAGPVPDIDPVMDPGGGAGNAGGDRFTPLVAPIPFKNTQIGWGLALLVGAIHRFDADTAIKPSTGAVGGFYTENGSWGVTLIELARLRRDAWRVRGMLSYLTVRYDFYGVGEGAGDAGRSVGIEQEIAFGTVSVLRRVSRGLYLGAGGMWMETSATLRDSAGLALPPVTDELSRTVLFAPGLQAELDTRNDDYWPAAGSLAKLTALFFTTASGSARTFQRYLAAWSWYTRLHGDRLILATNLSACGAAGEAPFYGLCSVGAGRYGLRGYTQGRYRDSVMTTVQAELRFHTAGRFGAAAFAGFGQVAPNTGDIFTARVLPAGGLGVRYRLTRRYPMHMRFDYAWGRNGGLLYFSVIEAF